MIGQRFATCVFAIGVMTNTAFAQTVSGEDTINSDLRTLLQAASEDGWIEFVPNGKPMNISSPETPGILMSNPRGKAPDCDQYTGIDADGLFSENPVKDHEINSLLPKLLEGLPLSETHLDLFLGLSDCGREFATWEHLALSQYEGQAVHADVAIAALYEQSPYIRQRAGLTLAIAAGLSGDIASLRRFADMLEDAKLHGTVVTKRDPRHILLESLLLEIHHPEEARLRFKWLSEHDGPEQFIAIERLTANGDADLAANSLDRLAEHSSQADRQKLTDLKLKAVLAQGQLSDVSFFLKNGSINPTEITPDRRTTLIEMTRKALIGDDTLEKIVALDLYSEFTSLYNGQNVEETVDLALFSILGTHPDTENTSSKQHKKSQPKGQASRNNSEPSTPARKSPDRINSAEAHRVILEISEDLMEAQKVLKNG